jgi:thioesterase domain-containing protein
VHGTAFAGSLYAIQALTGWGMMHLQLKLNVLDASIVIASGQINYAKPVAEDIFVRCSFGQHHDEMTKLKTSGKGRFPLVCEVLLADGSRAGEFSGVYAVRLNR